MEHLSPHATATESCVPRAPDLPQEKSPQQEGHTPQLQGSPRSLQPEEAQAAVETLGSQN